MNKKKILYSVFILFCFLLAHFLLGELFFSGPAAQAQCVNFKLASDYGGPIECGDGWTKINEIQTAPCGTATCGYCSCTRTTALCIGG